MHGVYLILLGNYRNVFCLHCKEGEVNFKRDKMNNNCSVNDYILGPLPLCSMTESVRAGVQRGL